MASLLIVDDEDGMRRSLSILFKKEGFHVFEAESGEVALEHVMHNPPDLIITDLRMDGMSGIDVLEYVVAKGLRIPVIIMTSYGTVESAVSAMKMGAYDYIAKPFEYDEILHRARKAINFADTDRDMSTLLRGGHPPVRDDRFSMIVGESAAIKQIKAQLMKIADNDFPVLITGETGTGKNLLAKAIHLNSPRSAGAFVPVNCTSIPEHLFESELFGHTKGAFTGAIIERKGLFEAAKGGTILLDEVGSMPKAMQAKLLGVLQDNRVRKVGSDEEVPINVRVIAATNSDLVAAIGRGEFREDLYYRINVFHLHIPPLREHREDIPLLSEKFLSLCTAQQGKDIAGFTPEAIDALYHCDYPGNVRELHNTICHAVAVSEDHLIDCHDMPTTVTGRSGCSPVIIDESAPMDIKEWEKRIILRSVKRHPNNLAEVCRELKIGRTTLWRKMKQYGIDLSSMRKSF